MSYPIYRSKKYAKLYKVSNPELDQPSEVLEKGKELEQYDEANEFGYGLYLYKGEYYWVHEDDLRIIKRVSNDD